MYIIFFKTPIFQDGDVAQWYSIRFACERPRVRSPASPLNFFSITFFFHYIFFPLQHSCLFLSLSLSLSLSLKAEPFLWKPKVCKNQYSFVCALTSLTVLQWQVTVMQYIIQNNKNHWNHIPKTPLAWKKLPKKKGHFAHIGNEIKICGQNKCHHHLSNICEN